MFRKRWGIDWRLRMQDFEQPTLKIGVEISTMVELWLWSEIVGDSHCVRLRQVDLIH
jgi:hypothetical protein